MESENGEDAWSGGLDRGTVGRNPVPQTEVRSPLGLDYHGTVREQLENIVDEGGAVTVRMRHVGHSSVTRMLIRQLRKSLQDLPAKEQADKLVAFFFTKVNHIRYPIDEHLFRQGKGKSVSDSGDNCFC